MRLLTIRSSAVIIPSSIIAQIVCPPDLIGTITAITLAIRYLGGAIGFTAYYNIFYPKLITSVTELGAVAVVSNGISLEAPAITTMLTLAAQAKYPALRDFIANGTGVIQRTDRTFDIVISVVQDAFVLAYRWPYWMSIAFGGLCFISSFGLKDIRKYL